MTRSWEIEYALSRNVPIKQSVAKIWSIEQKLWGRSIEGGRLEEPNFAPPEEIFQWTKSPVAAADKVRELTITFEGGVPVALDGEKMAPAKLIAAANVLAGDNAIGRIDIMEDRMLGLKVRENYEILTGVPAHVDGRILAIAETAGGVVSNRDRMWHYTEGIRNWNPIWPNHGIRILPGPSSLWLDAFGNRLPAELIPGSDTLAALDYITHTDQDHSWFVLNQAIIKREFALSGSEQNPDLTGRNIRLLFSRLASRRAPGPIESFRARGIDFAVAGTVMELADAMNGITGRGLIDAAAVKRAIETRDGSTEDPQMAAIHKARRFAGERLLRVAKPRPLLDPDSCPLIAVRLRLLSRKTLGGLQTDLSARVLDTAGVPIPGLFAAGEVTGFGGGGMHGYRALEGTFLGGCLFSGRIAGRSAAESVR